MTQHIQADGVGSIAIVDGNVRTTFYSYLAEPTADGQQAAQEPSLRLSMSLQGFIKTYQAFQRMAHDMEEKGIIQRQQIEKKQETEQSDKSPETIDQTEHDPLDQQNPHAPLN